MNEGISRRHLEILLLYLAALGQGICFVVFPAAGNIFTDPEFHHLTSSDYASLFLPMIVCAILASSLGGTLARRFGLKRVFMCGLASNFISMVLLALSARFVELPGVAYGRLLVSLAGTGVRIGATPTALNAYAVNYFPAKSHAAVAGVYSLTGIGGTIAPVLLAVSVGLGSWWGLPFAVGVGFLILFLACLTLPLEIAIPEEGSTGGEGSGRSQALPLRFWCYAGTILLYGICEAVIADWAPIYLHDEKGLSSQWAAFALSMFWAALTAGRLLVTAVSLWFSVRWLFATMPALMLACFLGIPMVEGNMGNIVAFGLAGLVCSAFLPLCISFAEKEFPEATERVSGLMMASLLLGIGIGAYGVGLLQDMAGFAFSTIYSGTGAFAGASFVLAYFLATTMPAYARARQ